MAKSKNTVNPLTALYIDKTPEEKANDEKTIEFFRYLLDKFTLEELLA